MMEISSHSAVVIGVDEVGRGALAGDVVVCAFALDPAAPPEAVAHLRSIAADSKSYTSRARREEAAAAACTAGLYEICRAGPETIDRINIRAATLSCMRDAARGLAARLAAPAQIVIDGRDVPEGLGLPARSVIGGDGSVFEISCASVIAKVLRDREMIDAAKRYPGYGFERNAGYGTAEHRDALARLGLSEIHRSWGAKFCPGQA